MSLYELVHPVVRYTRNSGSEKGGDFELLGEGRGEGEDSK